jgi:NAD(P)-dependent dehydrogenase (short-subunit alcohol dehydrogenase family)
LSIQRIKPPKHVHMHTNMKQAGQTTPAKSWVLITGASSGFGEEFARQYVEHGIRKGGSNEDHSRVAPVDDAAGSRGAFRDPGPTRRAHECGARLVQQGHGDAYLGLAALVAPGDSISRNEWVNRKDLS